MRTKLACVFLFGLICGLALPTMKWLNVSQAEQDSAPVTQGQVENGGAGWEYRVERFAFSFFAGTKEKEKDTDKIVKSMNVLNDEGWEYIGPIANGGSHNANGRLTDVDGLMAFRRPKR